MGALCHGHRLRQGDFVRRCQVSCVRQCGGAVAARYDLLLVNAGLQHLPGVIIVLDQAELIQPRPQVVPVVKSKSQGGVHLEESWCRNDGCLDAQPSIRVIICAMGCCELFALGRFRQRLPRGWELCVLRHLAQAEEVGQVCPQDIGESLALCTLSHTSLILPVSSHLHCHLPYVCGYQQPLHALQRKVDPGEVACQDLVAVACQFSLRKSSGRTRHGEGRLLVYPALPGEWDPEPDDDGRTIHCGTGVDDVATQATPILKWRQVAF